MAYRTNIVLDSTKVRNAVYQADGEHIDLEINHPDFGWIPYSYHPDDPGSALDLGVLAGLISNMTVAAYVPPVEEEEAEEGSSSAVSDSEISDILDGL